MQDEPYIISEFGEIVPTRPGGCPQCGEEIINASARQCWRCGATFAPIDNGPSHGGSGQDESEEPQP